MIMLVLLIMAKQLRASNLISEIFPQQTVINSALPTLTVTSNDGQQLSLSPKISIYTEFENNNIKQQ